MRRKYVFLAGVFAAFMVLAGAGLAVILYNNKQNIDIVQISYSHYADPSSNVTYKIDGCKEIAGLISYFDEMIYTSFIFDLSTFPCGGGLYTISMFCNNKLVREYNMYTGTPTRYIRFAGNDGWYIVSEEDAYKWDSYIEALRASES